MKEPACRPTHHHCRLFCSPSSGGHEAKRAVPGACTAQAFSRTCARKESRCRIRHTREPGGSMSDRALHRPIEATGWSQGPHGAMGHRTGYGLSTLSREIPLASLTQAQASEQFTPHSHGKCMRPENSSCVCFSEAELGADEGRITKIHLLASLASSFNCGHQFTRHCRIRLPTLLQFGRCLAGRLQ